MRSLLAAILSLFLPPRGAHRAADVPPFLGVRPAVFTPRPPHGDDVIAADGLPLVRPYVVLWERERDERRAAVLASLGQVHAWSEVAA
ncbi:hypothetical protein [Streptomyces sp. ME18-1-4]|uniref:hypothetical protein n=1 Tax=Streptomyces sp. ME18-1-4 TaxID=3028685 RepID=UPI0029BCCB30|nr:hypothetical protein [Streptomyces sp. ME18-1-4]MDX3245971.1 hypothetical protein [Streptomyces sp. ME18-1-4]